MKMEKSWAKMLSDEFSKEYMLCLQSFLQDEIKNRTIIYPPQNLIFNALCHTSFANVKVVIIGQDPYHGPGQAHGLSFSVPSTIAPPPSLKNIFKELQQDEKITPPTSGCLLPWAKQGVLLLNATLTVRANTPKSHYGKGWEIFTDRIVELLAKRKEPLVFMLWGSSAQEKALRILQDKQYNHHLLLQAPHPSPFSADRGFFGCRHFSKANQFLQKTYKKVINWQIP